MMLEPNMLLVQRRPIKDKNNDFQFLEKLEKAAESLLKQDNVLKALEFMTQALCLRKMMYGDDSNETYTYLSLILKEFLNASCNLIEKDDTKIAISVLGNIYNLTRSYSDKFMSEACDILNTTACAYRKINKLKNAKRYALAALKILKGNPEIMMNRASVYLNLCAIYSNLNEHQIAAEFCKLAVQNAQEEIVNLKLIKPLKEDYSRKITTLGVAYHNLGVEEELLKHNDSAIEWFRKAVTFMEHHGDNTQRHLLDNFKKTYEDAVKNRTNNYGKKSKTNRRKSEHVIERLLTPRYDHESRSSYSKFNQPELDVSPIISNISQP